MRGALVLLLLLPLAYGLEPFGESAVLPPPIPEQDQGKAQLTLMLLSIDDRPFSNAHVSVTTRLLDEEQETLHYTRNGTIILDLQPGSTHFFIGADLPVSEGADGYLATIIDVQGNMTKSLMLFPVGSVRGIVYDDSHMVVAGAEVKADCQGDYSSPQAQETDEIGTFSFDYLPLGSCRISARSGKAVGFAKVSVQQGSLADVEIVVKGAFVWWPYAGMALIALLGWTLYFIGTRRVKQKRAEEKKRGPSRADDIVSTLRETEKEVVMTLLSQGNEATMSVIYHKTGIPKTSLVRALQTLEAKQIISTKKVGKMRKVTLTDWFLGKGEKKPV
ncbi:MAG: hypothetical protein V1735_01765 [Nanoarchaeota archaeon]